MPQVCAIRDGPFPSSASRHVQQQETQSNMPTECLKTSGNLIFTPIFWTPIFFFNSFTFFNQKLQCSSYQELQSSSTKDLVSAIKFSFSASSSSLLHQSYDSGASNLIYGTLLSIVEFEPSFDAQVKPSIALDISHGIKYLYEGAVLPSLESEWRHWSVVPNVLHMLQPPDVDLCKSVLRPTENEAAPVSLLSSGVNGALIIH
ncbi:hypothetical protein KIW84_051156 [Lathyrus oleraceus]|uniref:Uncharacterized protein n=1 Tax=Pisum sativum TaxID=3888 RepID=A0A9D5AD59_PEA|nr:hypothetical protein KIW84_051156 [Pisum sativum]